MYDNSTIIGNLSCRKMHESLPHLLCGGLSAECDQALDGVGGMRAFQMAFLYALVCMYVLAKTHAYIFAVRIHTCMYSQIVYLRT